MAEPSHATLLEHSSGWKAKAGETETTNQNKYLLLSASLHSKAYMRILWSTARGFSVLTTELLNGRTSLKLGVWWRNDAMTCDDTGLAKDHYDTFNGLLIALKLGKLVEDVSQIYRKYNMHFCREVCWLPGTTYTQCIRIRKYNNSPSSSVCTTSSWLSFRPSGFISTNLMLTFVYGDRLVIVCWGCELSVSQLTSSLTCSCPPAW